MGVNHAQHVNHGARLRGLIGERTVDELAASGIVDCLEVAVPRLLGVASEGCESESQDQGEQFSGGPGLGRVQGESPRGWELKKIKALRYSLREAGQK